MLTQPTKMRARVPSASVDHPAYDHTGFPARDRLRPVAAASLPRRADRQRTNPRVNPTQALRSRLGCSICEALRAGGPTRSDIGIVVSHHPRQLVGDSNERRPLGVRSPPAAGGTLALMDQEVARSLSELEQKLLELERTLHAMSTDEHAPDMQGALAAQVVQSQTPSRPDPVPPRPQQADGWSRIVDESIEIAQPPRADQFRQPQPEPAELRAPQPARPPQPLEACATARTATGAHATATAQTGSARLGAATEREGAAAVSRPAGARGQRSDRRLRRTARTPKLLRCGNHNTIHDLLRARGPIA